MFTLGADHMIHVTEPHEDRSTRLGLTVTLLYTRSSIDEFRPIRTIELKRLRGKREEIV